jgi:hypothetical protein
MRGGEIDIKNISDMFMDYYTVRLTSGYQRFGGTWFLTASGYRLK